MRLIYLISLLTFAFSATANERFELDYTGGNGQGQVIRADQRGGPASRRLNLRQKFNQQYPGRNLDNFTLKRVVLFAKARHNGGRYRGGNAEAALRVNGQGEGRRTVYQVSGRRQWRATNQGSYQRIAWRGINERQGPWRIVFHNARVKVQKVVLVLERRRGRRLVEIGTERPDRIFGESQTWNARNLPRRPVQRLIIRADRRVVDIMQVRVTFGNGRSRNINNLQGVIYQGQRLVHDFARARNIESITIVSRTPAPFGPRGQYTLLARLGQRN